MAKKMKAIKVKGYMCSIDYDVELPNQQSAKVYPTIKSLKENARCTSAKKKDIPCGIYEVEISVQVKRVIKEFRL